MTTVTWPSDTVDIIDAIRGAIGRTVTIHSATVSGCAVCGLDPVTNTSVDSFCTVCSGLYWIKIYTTSTVSGHVTWGPMDELDWRSGGKLYDGECRVQIKYTVTNDNLVDNAEYFTVDAKRMTFKNKIYRGVPSKNRILINLEEQER